jgi:hypothetical protein
VLDLTLLACAIVVLATSETEPSQQGGGRGAPPPQPASTTKEEPSEPRAQSKRNNLGGDRNAGVRGNEIKRVSSEITVG